MLARTRSSGRLCPGVLARTVTVSPLCSLAVLTSFGRGCGVRPYAVLAAVGYNFGLLLRWLALLLRIVLAVLAAPSHSNRTIVAS